MSKSYRIAKLSDGERPNPWVIEDDTNVRDMRPWWGNNDGQGFRTRREAQAFLDDKGVPQAGRGRPTTGVRIPVRIPAEVLEVLDLEAEAHSVSRAELIRGVLWEWCRNGGYSVGPDPS